VKAQRTHRASERGKGGFRRPSPTGGFTLIEILVAISILGISLVVLLQLFSGALKSVRVSNDYTQGVFYAQEKMEEVLFRESLTPGTEEGDFEDGFRWRLEITRVDQAEEEALKLPFDMFQISVVVTWDRDTGGGGKDFQVTTLKVVKKDGAEEAAASEKDKEEAAD
jgi:general secretion pathway protein I